MRLLLDEHISPAVLSKAGVDAVALTRWHSGQYREEADDVLLAAKAAEGRVLVTHDQRGRPRRPPDIPPNDIGGLARALGELDRRLGRLDWTSRAVFLERPRRP